MQSAELSEVFAKIAEASGLNLIVSPHVQGTVTTRLVDVPWQQALDVILNMHRLGQERYGNVILITPLHDVAQRRQQAMQKRQLDHLAQPTVTRVITINYADAATLKSHLDNLLGHCAVIGADAHSNSLIITGTPSCLKVHHVPRR
jgi:type IV pilus assembly protein PilQ